MVPPKFWAKKDSFLGLLLSPLGLLYAFGGWIRSLWTRPYRSQIPILCCGNITLGGTGKTPTALALGASLQKNGKTVVYLTRGWGGALKGPFLVDLNHHTCAQTGDEALLLARQAQTVVSVDRQAGAKFIENALPKTDYIIMDDGFQNPSVEKSASLLIFDGGVGLGNGRVFPAGPLRESLDAGLKRATGVLIIGKDETGMAEKIRALSPSMVVLSGSVSTFTNGLDKNQVYGAFAGIGRPEKFFTSLATENVKLAFTHPFPDHWAYTDKDLNALLSQAKSRGAQLITTEKDFVRLPSWFQPQVLTLPIKIEAPVVALISPYGAMVE